MKKHSVTILSRDSLVSRDSLYDDHVTYPDTSYDTSLHHMRVPVHLFVSRLTDCEGNRLNPFFKLCSETLHLRKYDFLVVTYIRSLLFNLFYCLVNFLFKVYIKGLLQLMFLLFIGRESMLFSLDDGTCKMSPMWLLNFHL